MNVTVAIIINMQILCLLAVSAGIGLAAPAHLESTQNTIAANSEWLNVDDAEVVFCEELPDPAAEGLCTVTAGRFAGRALLIKGNVLAVETIYEGGEVLIDTSGLIRYLGCSADRPQELDSIAARATKIECAEGVVSPGLINAHDHLTYNHNYPFSATTERYDHRNDWRQEKTGLGDSNPLKVTWSELRQIMVGTTSIAGSGGILGCMRNLDLLDMYYNFPFPAYDALLWQGFLAGPTSIVSDTFPLESPGDYTQNEGDCSAYRYLGASHIPDKDVYVPHLAEGVNAAAHNEFACLSSTDRSGVDIVDHSFAMIHGIALDANDGNVLAQDNASLIWSPRSNMSLYGNTAPVSMLKNQGVLLSLSTDWTPSGSMNLGRELVCADSLNKNYFDNAFTDRELWLMVTLNPALALHVDDRIGALKAGLFADIAIYDGRGKVNPYRAIIGADARSTVLVLQRAAKPYMFMPLTGPRYTGAEALYGDASLLQSLSNNIMAGIPSCETLNVCGAEKMFCRTVREVWWTAIVARATGGPGYKFFSNFDLSSKNADSYPLNFCDAPPDEPTCIPFRPGEYDGTILPDTDRDGDGIPDAEDNCPGVFNPVRPMDDGIQADADDDGKGDACDAYPLTAEL